MSELVEPRPVRLGRTWAAVALLSLGFTIAYIDRTNLSVALASAEFRAAFHLTDTQRGLLHSAFFWSYALLQIPAGYVTDRWGVRWPYAIGFSVWSVFSALTAFAGGMWQIFACRLLLGVGEAIVTPASIRWIALNVPERNRGLAVAILFAGAKFGPAIGADLSVRLLQAFGWKGMFLVLGTASLVFLIPWFLLIKEDEKPAATTKSNADAPGIWGSPVIYGILAGTVAYNYFNYFNLTWLPSYFVERWGLPLKEMGFYTAFSFLGMAAAAIAAGALADRLIAKGRDAVFIRKAFTMGGLAIACLEVLGTVAPSRDYATAIAIVSMAGLGLTTANYWALTQALMPGAAIGRVSGIQNCAANLAGVAAPSITGFLVARTGSYEAPMYAILATLLMGIAAYALVVRPEYAPRRRDE